MPHRTAAPPRAGDGPTPEAFPPVPVFAAAASTARVPATLATALRHATADLGRRVTDGRGRTPGSAVRPVAPGRPARSGIPGDPAPWRLWAELVRGYLALALTLLPRPRPVRTITVFVAAGETLSVRPSGPAERPWPQGPPRPGPDATP